MGTIHQRVHRRLPGRFLELKGLHLALEEQRLSLDALHRRQAELSEENAALRDCLESIGILCGQAFLSRLHLRRFQRVLHQHPLPARPSKTLEVLTPELAVNIAAYSGILASTNKRSLLKLLV
eukprot:Skav216747  [mRNA]  locus=scaffold178:459285:465850:+ [translate_table: standard]